MAEHDTTPLPDRPDPPSDEVQFGWQLGPNPAPPAEADELTRTKPEPSTPAPAAPDHQTQPVTVPVKVPEPDWPDIPGYRFEHQFPGGAMGTVYRVRDVFQDVDRALKVALVGGRDPGAVRMRFLREVQALAAVQHPNVIPILHAGEANGNLYFVMPVARRGSLAGHLAEYKDRPRASAELVAKVARGVAALHAAGRLHRDLKPHNILLGERDEPMVADCGLVTLLADPDGGEAPAGCGGGLTDTGPADALHTVSGAAVGTRFYMSPEQAEGRAAEYGPGCDVWATGVVLYEMLTGRRPFTDDGPVDIFQQIALHDPPPLARDVPPELARVVGQCLRKRPADRYPSAAAVADDLEGWLKRESRRRVLRRAFAAAAVTAVGGVALLPHVLAGPAPVPKVEVRSIGDRLRAGETVHLTDSHGKPLVPVAVPRGTRSPAPTSETNPDGDTVFTSVSNALLQFSDEPLPPARLEGTLVVPAVFQGATRVGVFAGGRERPDGGHTSVRFLMRHVPKASPALTIPGKPDPSPTLDFGCTVHRTGGGPPQTANFGGVQFPWPLNDKGQYRDWAVPIAVELRPGTVAGEVLGKRLTPGTAQDFGNGLGLVLSNGSVVARNLRLVPTPPPGP